MRKVEECVVTVKIRDKIFSTEFGNFTQNSNTSLLDIFDFLH